MYTKVYTDGTKELEDRYLQIDDAKLAESLWHYVPLEKRKYIINDICDYDEATLLEQLNISANKMLEILKASGEDALKDPTMAILKYSPEYSSFTKWDCPDLRAYLSYFVFDCMRTATKDINDNYARWMELGDTASGKINK